MRRLLTLILFAALAGGAFASPDNELARRLLAAGEILPLEAIVEKAHAVQPGQLLEVELKHKRQPYLYEVEVLDPDGRVWELEFDARTGELLTHQEDD